MTERSDPWAPRPEPGAGPTEPAGAAAGTGGRPSDSTPTEYLPGTTPTEYFGGPPGMQDPRVLPPHDAQWGSYEPGAGAGMGSGVEYQPTAAYPGTGYHPTEVYPHGYRPTESFGPPGVMGGGPPGVMSGGPTSVMGGGPDHPAGPGGYQPGGFPPQQPPPRRNTTMWIALAVGAVIVVGIVGVILGSLVSRSDSPESVSSSGPSHTTAFQLPSGPARTSAHPLPSGVPAIPGLGGLDELGAAMGTIAGNDGSTLSLTTLSGGSLTVKTDAETQVISLGSTKVADLAVGEVVMVQGDKNTDGSIQAKLIFSTSLPGGTR